MSAPRLTIGLVRRGHSDTGGAEAYLKRLARGLSESGHATRLFTDAAWPAREWSWGPITRLRGETARRFADELEKIDPTRPLRSAFESRASLALRCLSRRRRHSPGLDATARRRFVSLAQPAPSLQRQTPDTLELEQALFSGGASRVIANSHMVKREAEEYYGYPADRIDVVPNGVPLADFHPDPEARASAPQDPAACATTKSRCFLSDPAGNAKACVTRLEAVESLGKKFRLFVAGRGRGRKVGGRAVQQLGAVRDLPALYAAADIFLLPTLYDPFSNACLEALAAGLPVDHHARQRFQRDHRAARSWLNRRCALKYRADLRGAALLVGRESSRVRAPSHSRTRRTLRHLSQRRTNARRPDSRCSRRTPCREKSGRPDRAARSRRSDERSPASR